uniref:hypothetical protein Ycf22 n=1 Tax=Gloiopeltis furcata TaxID=42017 RepID=UPI0028D1973E|nr:hypothetical protein Ycf22 [Gloiopeltis furcata]WMP13851.1 hypothetical protein Ycf22 [Gloiopeltis furcata]
MNKIRSKNFVVNIKNLIVFLFFMFFTIIIWLTLNSNSVNRGYLLFIEFKNAYGIKQGTSIRMRGMNIGHIKNTRINLNSILVLAHINSRNILIPRNSIIETNQTGLLNDTVIDIIPLENIEIIDRQSLDVFSLECAQSNIICNLSIVEGDRGLNYDDLVRATTRISQRFDDPSFFHLFYLFLQNSIELSSDLINISMDISSVAELLHRYAFSILAGRT